MLNALGWHSIVIVNELEKNRKLSEKYLKCLEMVREINYINANSNVFHQKKKIIKMNRKLFQ